MSVDTDQDPMAAEGDVSSGDLATELETLRAALAEAEGPCRREP